jgi:uncharacterized protein
VDVAETLLHDLGLRTYRVRYHDEHTARIEAGPEEFLRLLRAEIRTTVIERLKKLGFIYITLDLQGYRSGSMNEVLPPDAHRKHTA